MSLQIIYFEVERKNLYRNGKLFACCFCCCLLTFFQINFYKKSFQEHYKSVKQFGSRSGPTFCLQSVSADDKSFYTRIKEGQKY